VQNPVSEELGDYVDGDSFDGAAEFAANGLQQLLLFWIFLMLDSLQDACGEGSHNGSRACSGPQSGYQIL
jgi:hypothetical protein